MLSGRAAVLHRLQLRVDQVHRGLSQATDAGGYAALNVLYMR